MAIDATVAKPSTETVRGGTVALADGGASRDVDEQPITVGRDPACDLVIDDPEVSAIHLEVRPGSMGLIVRDLGSLNGSMLGSVRISQVEVTTPQRFGVGSSTIEVRPGPARPLRAVRGNRFGPLVGASTEMRVLFERLSRAAGTELTVLIGGETGTGKELVARAIHEASPRRSAPFVVIDCAAIPRTLGEATLLGHERGAFTGADRARLSPFLEAKGGTVFLDELGELPLEIQPNLLRVLSERRIKPVGGNRYVDVDVRIVAATRQNLLAQVNAGNFRSDLYFRLAQLRVEVPPLRDRRQDIPLIVGRVLEELGEPDALQRVPLDSLERLMHHDFPGNVRELKNATIVAHALSGDGPIDVAHYVQEALTELAGPTVVPVSGAPSGIESYHEAKRRALDAFERQYFESLVALAPDNISEMSRLSGLSRLHVRKHLQRHGIVVQRPGQPRSD